MTRFCRLVEHRKQLPPLAELAWAMQHSLSIINCFSEPTKTKPQLLTVRWWRATKHLLRNRGLRTTNQHSFEQGGKKVPLAFCNTR
jgi:hypothetical protein